MPSSFVIVIAVVGVAVFVVRVVAIHRGWATRMTHLAATRGWRAQLGWLRRPSAVGEVDGCRVVVEMPWRIPDRHDRKGGLLALFARRRESAWDYARMTVTLPRALPLSFEPESTSSIGRLLSRRDLELGDPTFDDVVRLGGREAALRAAFDGPTRWAVRLLVERGGTFDGEALRLAWQHDDQTGRDAEAIDCALEASQRLQAGTSPSPERLAQIAADDPKPGVRRGALACLMRRSRAATATDAAIRRALTDDDPAMRLLAAGELGDQPTLEALVPPGHPPEVRVGAVEALGRTAEGRAFLRGVVARLDGEARAAAITALRAAGDVPVGGLALAEVEGGGLSVAADDAAGKLSPGS